MTLDPIPPKPGYVTTRKAALLYGKSQSAVIKALHEEGIVPEVTPKSSGECYYWWNPVDVLKVRAVRAERWARVKALFATRASAGKLGNQKLIIRVMW